MTYILYQEKQNKVVTGAKVELGNLVATALSKLTKEDQEDELALLQVIIPSVMFPYIYIC